MALSTLLAAGQAFMMSKKYKAAVLLFEKCAEKFPDDFRVFYNLAAALAPLHRYEDAIINLDKCRILNPNIVEMYEMAGAIFIKLGDPHTSTICSQIGLSIDPDNTTCLYNLNISLRQEGKFREALSFSWGKCGICSSPLQRIVFTPLPLPSAAPTVTFVCVKWGSKYGSVYVNNMYHGLAHYLEGSQYSFRLVCLTDNATDLHDDITILPFNNNGDVATFKVEGWWCKAHLFSPETVALLPPGDVLFYLDLDTLICNELCPFVRCCLEAFERQAGEDLNNPGGCNTPFITINARGLPSEGRNFGINSSVMVWRNGDWNELYGWLGRSNESSEQPSGKSSGGGVDEHTNYAAIRRLIYKWDHYLEMMLFKCLVTADVEGVDGICQDSFSFCTALASRLPRRRTVHVSPVGEHHVLFLHDLLPSSTDVIEYNSVCEESFTTATKVMIIIFPLLPKPHQLDHDKIVSLYRRYDIKVAGDSETVLNETSSSIDDCKKDPKEVTPLFQLSWK